MNTRALSFIVFGSVLLGLSWNSAQAQSIKVAVIEPLSGPVAAVGQEAFDNLKYSADQINDRGGVLGGRKLEIVPFDNAMNAEKTTQQLKKALDRGFRFVIQGVGSNHALNIIKQVNKHNKRNPGRRMLYLNSAAVTTAFTNELCSFWHFRFDANVDMKVAGLATQMGRDPSIKKVYMINQNYAFGKSVQAAGRRMIKQRTNARLVGDDLIVPFGKTLDFTPYVAKIQSSGADTVLTGNWGPDLTRLVKAVGEAGLKVKFYTFYAGIPSSIFGYGKENGKKVQIKQITEMHLNDEKRADVLAFAKASEKKFKRSWYSDRYRFLMEMFAKALDKAGSDKPIAVARALEGMTYPGARGEMVMRAKDHQIQLPMVVSSIDLQAKKMLIYNGKQMGMGWRTDGWISREELTLPTTCKMKRPR